MSAHDAVAYTAGSSGATYFTAGTLCAALLLSGARERLLGLVGPAIALLMWVALNDGHGVLFLEGFLLGLVMCWLAGVLHIPTPFQRSDGHQLDDGAAA